MASEQADLIRKRYKYRELILSGRLKLPHPDAAKLLGPDCAYHLYAFENAIRTGKSRKKKRSR